MILKALSIYFHRAAYPQVYANLLFLPPIDSAKDPDFVLPKGQPNILLIILEGVSGAFLPSIAGDREEEFVSLPNLDRLSQTRGTMFSNYWNHNRKTNRGLFSLLCGEYPNFSRNYRPKMESWIEIDEKIRKPCLLGLLRKEGYHTFFAQGAELVSSSSC